MLNEEKIINIFKNSFPLSGGIGDDAAIIATSKDESFLISKDLFLEDVHFRLRYYSPEDLAYKALHVNFSDIYAMGGEPLYVLLGIAIPISFDQLYLNELLNSFVNICKASNIQIIGGDTTNSSDKLLISITVIGKAKNLQIKMRNKAEIGDILCVAGKPGYASIGLATLEDKIAGFDDFKLAAKRPKLAIKEALWLARNDSVASMMDLSDGLAVDLTKLCQASKVSAQIEITDIDFDEDFAKACESLNLDKIKTYLSGGEDYGLLYSVRRADYDSFIDRFSREFGCNPCKIGEVIEQNTNRINFTKNGESIFIDLKIFSHFGEL